ncbi:MAG: hypothetical protein IJ679_13065 [Lachnospiraceae bacterium]|nr:hypothetical protein [Lachnospiraceae bacterium]
MIKRLIIISICISLICGLWGYDINAKANKVQALEAYAGFMGEPHKLWNDSRYTTDEGVEFKTIDVNKDGTPELLIYDKGSYVALGYWGLYAYVQGKVKLIQDFVESVDFYPNKRGVIFIDENHGGGHREECWTFDGENSTLQVKLVAGFDSNYQVDYSTAECIDGNGNKITMDEFYSVKNNLVGKSKMVRGYDDKLLKNTKSNRKKFLSEAVNNSKSKGEYWLYGIGPGGSGGTSDDAVVDYSHGKLTISGLWGKGKTKEQAQDAHRAWVDETFPVADDCKYVTVDDEVVTRKLNQSLVDQKGIYFCAFGVNIHVKNGKITQIIETN